MALPVSITILIVSLYTLVVFLFSYGFRKMNRPGKHDPFNATPVSVIIPFRNERQQLPDLLEDLMVQSYPEGLMEIIFINDHSEDDSLEILNALIGERTGVFCLNLPEDQQGKKAALFYGIQHASHNWIIQTDADCRVGSGFVASHMAFLEKNPSDLVAGLVTTRKESGAFLESFERLDLLSLAGVSAASFNLKRPVMCSGANLVYSKDLYMNTRPFDPSEKVASGDDMFLMIGARKLGKTLSYNPSRESMVETVPVRTLRLLIEQRIRWGAKSVHYRMYDIQLLAILVVMTNLSVLAFPLWMVCFPETWRWLLLSWGLKTIADFCLLLRIARIAGQSGSLWMFLPVALAYYWIFLLILVGTFLKKSGWNKGSIR